MNNKTFESIIKLFQFYKRHKNRCEWILQDLREKHERRQLKHQDDLHLELFTEAKEQLQETEDNYSNYQEQLAHAFYLLSENIANYAKFSNIDVDDAIQEGVLICFEKIDRFDPRKGKAFNYMTTCILNHYRQLYRGAKSYNEFKKRYHLFLQDKFDSIIVRNGKERSSKTSVDKHSNII